MTEKEKLEIERSPINIRDAYLSRRTERILQDHGIENLNDLTQLTSRDVLSWRELGKKSLNEIREKLAFHGLALKDETVDLDIKKTILIDLPKTLRDMKRQIDEMQNELRFFAHKIDQVATYAEKTKEKLPDE